MIDEQTAQIIKDQHAEIVRLQEAIRRLADQDATLSVCNGNITVEMDAITPAEFAAVETAAKFMTGWGGTPNNAAADILHGLLERLKILLISQNK